MPRHKNNPTFDPAKLEAEVLKTVIELFNSKDRPDPDTESRRTEPKRNRGDYS